MIKYLSLIFCILVFLFSPAYAGSFDQPRTIGDSFGVEVDDDSRTAEQFQHIKDAGFGYVRISMTWNGIEKSRGHYDWREFDRIMPTLRSLGLKPIIILWWGNAAYSGTMPVPVKVFGQESLPPAPASAADLQAFSAFAAAAVRRYGAQDVIWEIWNEPNGDSFWVPEPDAKAYARLASSACLAIRTVSPQANIIGPALSGNIAEKNARHADFMETLYQSPLVSCLDALSMHPYREKGEIPETAIDDYNQAKKFIADHTPPGQKPLPLVNSEWGYSLTDVTPQEQAAYVLRALFSGLMNGIPLSIAYQWKDTREGTPEDREAHFGLNSFDGASVEALDDIQHILPRIHDAVYEKNLDAGDPQIYAISLLKPDGQRILAIWTIRSFSETAPVLHIKNGAKETSVTVRLLPQLIYAGTDLPVLSTTQVAKP